MVDVSRSGVVVCDHGRVERAGTRRTSPLDRRIIALAIPALGTLAIEPLYILVDTGIVGRLGTDPLAGLAIASTVLLTISSFVMFLQYGVTPDVARAIGAGDDERARVAAADSAWLAVLLGVPVGLLVAALARPLAVALGGHGAVLAAAVTYLRISAIGLPFVFVTMVGHGVMRGRNNLTRPLVVVLVANVVNVVLELLVVYGFHMGVAGSAWSTVVVQIGAAAAFGGILRPFLARVRPTWARLRPVLARGGHLGLRSVAMLGASWVASTRVAATVDTATLAANQVLVQLFTFLALGLDALAIPAQSLVAGALGAHDEDEAMAIGRSSLRLSLWVAGGLFVVLAATSGVLPRVFSADGAVISRVTAGALFLAVMQIPGAVAFSLDGVLIGGHDTRYLGRAAVLNLIPWLPFIAAVLLFPQLGIGGLWAGQLALMTTRAAINLRRFRSRRWIAGSSTVEVAAAPA
ncbi:MAG: putative MatE family transporter [Ilumatobacteraceae bacterium]|nr:putative MatE family transporter [Ilumatobacteraceae bacterium]